ncbi:TetR/AcrR family transcriptional regulator [Dongia soli]|uniref:TetR/AcrR family transcriptional regulator n=1 Tax=Dongia soli TaxID=600628 RepID=A0ABU5EK82_9PROT|nr:TetR/AcrR family transcriptional regulator [Dongia soli]MDY0885546.1 TetR/AcrR family transcriptional regulator [Dongia soli]
MPSENFPESAEIAIFSSKSEPGEEQHWRQKRRRNILTAAGALFARDSYDAVQMDDIARLAGVGKPTIYRYFDSKDELFLEVFREALEQLEQGIGRILSADITATQALSELLRLSFNLLGNQVSALRLLTGDRPQLIVQWREEFSQRRGLIMTAFRKVLQRGIDENEFRAVDVDVLPAIFIGVVRGGLMGVDQHGVGPAHLSETAVDLLLSGLRKDAATA